MIVFEAFLKLSLVSPEEAFLTKEMSSYRNIFLYILICLRSTNNMLLCEHSTNFMFFSTYFHKKNLRSNEQKNSFPFKS